MLVWLAVLDEKLWAAAYNGDAAGVREWLEAGADPKAANPEHYGRTAMHRAAAGGKSVEVLEVLLGAGAEVDKADEYRTTPLMGAAECGATGAVLRWLLEHGADWRLQAKSGLTALGFAKREGAAEAASVLAAWVSEQGSAQEAAAAAAVAQEAKQRQAAGQGDLAGVREWLEAGADPKAPDSHGITAMHRAAAGGKSVEVLEALRGAGAEVDKADADGETPLMYAARNGATGAVVRWLLEHGADWRLQATSGDYAGKTALDIAKRQGEAEAASVLAAWVSEHGSTEEAAAVVQEMKQRGETPAALSTPNC
eukprot:COSAG06_NODE_4449_length_4252_cov_21.903443_1_plen_310_part_10